MGTKNKGNTSTRKKVVCRDCGQRLEVARLVPAKGPAKMVKVCCPSPGKEN